MNRFMTTIVLLFAFLPLSAQGNGRPKVALVLGGGGAKGAASVGVLKYIEASEVPIDMVVGTSIGSIVGGLYAVGYRSEELDSMFRHQDWLKMGMGSLMGDSIVRVLRGMAEEYGNVNFDSLPKPFRCVAVDMKSMKEVVLREGDLAQAMRASMAIPVVFKPVKIDGRRLIDGGVLNNLPVDVAKDMGADIVIAIDLTVNKHENGKTPFFRPDLKKYRQNSQAADIYINPDLKGYGAQSFMPSKIAEMIALGEKAGKKALKDLKKLKKKLN